jgi:outer membrane cobalamin receptor
MMRILLKSLSGIAISLMAASVPAVSMHAAEAAVDLFALSLQELMSVKITSSTLTEESLQTVPSSMTVYTRADIRRLGLRHLHELVNLVPGFQSSRADESGLNYTMSSRGRRVGTSSREVLLMIDGQRINDDWTGGSTLHDQLITLENVEKVEVIRGPGSAIYGSNAMMGVINITTGSDNSLAIDAGSHASRHASAQAHAKGAVGKLDVYVGHQQSNGESYSHLPEPFPNPATPDFVQARDPYRADDIYLRAELGEFTAAIRANSRDTEDFYEAGSVGTEIGYLDTRGRSLNLGWQRTLNDSWDLKGYIYRSERELSILAPALALPVTPFTPSLWVSVALDEVETGTQWILQGERWLAGWEWRNPVLTDTTLVSGASPAALSTPTDNAPEDGRYVQGYFVQYQRTLTDTLAMTLGLRHDDYSDFGEHSSPRLALVQQLGKQDTLKLLYSEAFRAPSRAENSSYNLPVSPLFSNANLQPETAKTAELVWLHTLANGYFTGTWFDTRLQDAISEIIVSTPFGDKRSWVNGQQNINGLELEWKNHWSDNWQTRLALTHILHPDSALHTESNSLLGGSVSYENRGWTASLLANYQSAKIDPNEQQFPADITSTESTRFGGRTLVGAHIAKLLAPELEIYLHADNLLNKQYSAPANRPANYEGVPAAGRVLTLGVRWTFD